MQLELVLNEEEKKEIFQASMAKKKREETAPYRVANVVEPIYSASSQRSIKLSMTNPRPRAPVLPFQMTASSYYNRPTGTVAPIQNLSLTSSWTSAPLTSTSLSSGFEQNTSLFSRSKANTYLPSEIGQNTSSSSIFEQNTFSTSGFEQSHTSLYSRLGQISTTVSSIKDIKDQELISKPIKSNKGNICENDSIFKHKNFGAKKRESGPVMKNTDYSQLVADPLEETARKAETLNR
jgi:hypothetical protein